MGGEEWAITVSIYGLFSPTPSSSSHSFLLPCGLCGLRFLSGEPELRLPAFFSGLAAGLFLSCFHLLPCQILPIYRGATGFSSGLSLVLLRVCGRTIRNRLEPARGGPSTLLTGAPAAPTAVLGHGHLIQHGRISTLLINSYWTVIWSNCTSHPVGIAAIFREV